MGNERNKQWQVGILLFDHVDVLDYSGPYEVFSLTVWEAAQVPLLLMNRIAAEDKPFCVKTVSQDGQLVTAHNGLKIQPDYSFHDHPAFDITIIPGGPLNAVKSGKNNAELLQWIVSQHRCGSWVASICSGAIMLAEAGLLVNKQATTNAFAMDYLAEGYPSTEVVQNVRFVDNGDIFTSAGVSAGIDLSFHMVARLLGQEVARTTSLTIEYPYYEPN
ncbi:DJ-1/PfpI family protein [Paenibacillus sp. MMS18-CY102]|nr:DJ-1/PfpI family protein [Paenibacillus sp. MMS18-CY102]